MNQNFKIIGFDADDTLWVNEPYFHETEQKFCNMLIEYGASDTVSKELFKTEIQNLETYGFGTKSFMLSMIETAMRISNHSVSNDILQKIIDLGKKQINKPIELLDGIEEMLGKLHDLGYKLIVATKGDLLDQERKLSKSNIEQYFHHIEIMSDKKEESYTKLLHHLDIRPEEFLMIGNSLKSDILPVINIGGYGVHIPYHTTWLHEEIDPDDDISNYWEIPHISDLTKILNI